MCLLLILRGRFASHPVLVASNRDERRDRKFSPPSLWVGANHRALSPRDREKGGTWMCVNESGLFAGLTNWSRSPIPAGASTRGDLPHLAADAGSVHGAVRAVEAAVRARPYGGFQLALADRERIVVMRHCDGGLSTMEWGSEHVVLTNEHAPGQLELPGIAQALALRATPDEQLDAMRPLLAQRGEGGGHPVLKKGATYGTVSSSLLAIPQGDPQQLVWRFASGAPDEAEYRNYGNLGRRLLQL